MQYIAYVAYPSVLAPGQGPSPVHDAVSHRVGKFGNLRLIYPPSRLVVIYILKLC